VSLPAASWRELTGEGTGEIAAAPGRPAVPAVLVGRPAVLLTAARTDNETGVGGAVALGWRDLLRRADATLRRRRASVLAELLAWRLAIHPGLLAVVDAAVVGLGPAPADLEPVAAHTLLASTDAVALDATVARWFGFDPARIPHLRACADGGLGEVRAAEIRLVGEPGLLEMTPGLGAAAGIGGALPPRLLRQRSGAGLGSLLRRTRAEKLAPLAQRCGDLLGMAAWRRRGRWRRFLTSPWGRLWEHYLTTGSRRVDAA
jgi:hypothetical protein